MFYRWFSGDIFVLESRVLLYSVTKSQIGWRWRRNPSVEVFGDWICVNEECWSREFMKNLKKKSSMQNVEENVSRYRWFPNDVFVPVSVMSQNLRWLLKATKKPTRRDTVEIPVDWKFVNEDSWKPDFKNCHFCFVFVFVFLFLIWMLIAEISLGEIIALFFVF